jgi:DNA end-binding protein Ku
LPRALWKGSISLGLVNIPVAIYIAAKDRIIEFHNLCGKCHTPLTYKRWCPHCEREVAWNEIVKGYKISKDKYVVISKKELEAIRLKSTKAIEIVQFIDASQIDPLFMEKNYYLVPQEGGEKAYTLFRNVLEITGKAAIGKVVFRGKQHLVAIRHYKKGLIMTVLHYKDEIIPMEELEALKRMVVIKEAEIRLAKALIEKLSGKFEIEKFKDEYVEAVARLIKKKAAGEKIKEKPIEIEPTPSRDLMKALKASVEAVKKRKKKV